MSEGLFLDYGCDVVGSENETGDEAPLVRYSMVVEPTILFGRKNDSEQGFQSQQLCFGFNQGSRLQINIGWVPSDFEWDDLK